MLPSPSLAPSSFLQSAPNPSDWDQSPLCLISFPSSAETTVISGIEWVCFNTVSLGHGNEKHRKLKCSHQNFTSSCAGLTWFSLVQHQLRSVFSPMCLSPDTYSMPSLFFHHLSRCLIGNWCKYFFRELCWQQDLSHMIPVAPHGLGEGISWQIPTWDICCKVGCLKSNSPVLFHSCLSIDKQSMPDLQSTWKPLFAKGCFTVSSNPHKPSRWEKQHS